LIKHDAVIKFFNEVVAIAAKKDLLSGEHFSVDGTLIQAWAGHKSFVRKDSDDQDNDGGSAGDFKGSKRSNETHQSTTDPDARLYRKGKTASELRYMGHTLTDNRHGLVVNARVTHADGHAEREAAKIMINDARQAAEDANAEITLGADKGYDAQEFIEACQEMKVTPHVAQNTSGRRSAVPDAIARSVGYAISQQKRKLIEQGFGWAKTVGRMRQVMVRSLEKVDHMFVLNMAAYNLVRMRSLGQVRP
jgi:IS5 family transposase